MTRHDVTRSPNTIEVDLVTDDGAWTIRLNARAGTVGLLVVDHVLGRPVIAELLRSPTPAPE